MTRVVERTRVRRRCVESPRIREGGRIDQPSILGQGNLIASQNYEGARASEQRRCAYGDSSQQRNPVLAFALFRGRVKV